MKEIGAMSANPDEKSWNMLQTCDDVEKHEIQLYKSGAKALHFFFLNVKVWTNFIFLDIIDKGLVGFGTRDEENNCIYVELQFMKL